MDENLAILETDGSDFLMDFLVDDDWSADCGTSRNTRLGA